MERKPKQPEYHMVGIGDPGKPEVTKISAEKAEALKQMRANQYLKDRAEVLNSMNIDDWIVFSLRWGLAPPPAGFEDRETLLGLMHKVRLSLPQSNDIQKLSSAHYLVSHRIKLPGTFKLEGGVLTGSANALG